MARFAVERYEYGTSHGKATCMREKLVEQEFETEEQAQAWLERVQASRPNDKLSLVRIDNNMFFIVP